MKAIQHQITVLQLWSTDGKEKQAGWLRTMRSRIGALRQQPGFMHLTTLESVDGSFVAVHALWQCLADAERAISSAESKAGHNDLLVWGSPVGSNFRVVDMFDRQGVDGGDLA